MAGPYDPQVAQWFAAVDVDRSGRISAAELQSALMSSNGRQFSETACRLMIGKLSCLIAHSPFELQVASVKNLSPMQIANVTVRRMCNIIFSCCTLRLGLSSTFLISLKERERGKAILFFIFESHEVK